MKQTIKNRAQLQQAIRQQKQEIAALEVELQNTLQKLPKQGMQAILGGVLPAVASTQLTHVLFNAAALVGKIFANNSDASSLKAGVTTILKQAGFVGLLRIIWKVFAK